MLGALTSLTVVAPRFLRRAPPESGRSDYLGRMAERMIDLVLDGAATPTARNKPQRQETQ